ncbi:MAG: 3-methyl-2-oxobutanoate hydroxymethyltransferase [Vicinamibacterales bacterium]
MTDATSKLTLADITATARRGGRLVMVTAYDASAARLADAAGIDIILVGDSAAMTVLGHDSTLPVTMDEMLMMTRAVTRVTRRALVVADMPFGTYQPSDEQAVANAVRFVKDGGADAVKLEGAGRSRSRIRAIRAAGIPVMGHVGLTPQSVALLGGYRAQGRSATDARGIYDGARGLERAGCFAVVLEAIPASIAAHITSALAIPTIGIGAGPSCGGQVLVWHDLLGLTEGHLPRFVKQYASLSATIREALEAYAADVRSGSYPEEKHTYGITEPEADAFAAGLPHKDGR